jgi:catechol 2,3-dioxygenase-like lactoylglutathione lyase family enzyme/DNA-binding CsgD family transcriptional regulator
VLTPAEWRVLSLVQHGLSDRQIARLRGTSLEAVKFHRRNIAGKLDVAGRAGMRFWRRRRGDAAQEEAVMDETSLVQGVGQVSLETRDIERSVAFYRDTLGLAHLYTFPHPAGHLAFFDIGGLRLFISSHEDRPFEKSSVIYFTVAHIQQAYSALEAKGVRFEGAPHLIHRHESGVEEWMAFFRDPDANILALMAAVQPGGPAA